MYLTFTAEAQYAGETIIITTAIGISKKTMRVQGNVEIFCNKVLAII
jgi:hypothetical protein